MAAKPDASGALGATCGRGAKLRRGLESERDGSMCSQSEGEGERECRGARDAGENINPFWLPGGGRLEETRACLRCRHEK